MSPDELEQQALAVFAELGASGVDTGQTARARVLASIRAGAVPTAVLGDFTRARAGLRAGWQAFVAADIDIARDHLQQALTAAERVLGLQGGALLYADISLRLAAVLMQRGARDEALVALAAVRALDPGRPVTLSNYAPDVVDAYRELAPDASARHQVSIDGQPGDARVYLDGRSLGPAPVSLELSPGAHALVVDKPGYQRYGRIWHVDAEHREAVFALEPEPHAAALVALALPVAGGLDAKDVTDALTGLAVYDGDRPVLLLASVWRADRPALVGQRCRGVPIRCTAAVETRYPEPADSARAVGELWAQLTDRALDGEPVVASDHTLWPARRVEPTRRRRPRARADDRRKRCRLCRSPWLWAGIGAALATTGTVLWATRERVQTPVITVDPCAFSGCGRFTVAPRNR